jgi:error-prone DNA polymerase
VAGLVLVRQRPGTAAGICFITIEDETGYANRWFLKTVRSIQKEILQSRFIDGGGQTPVEGEVIHASDVST